MVIILVLVLGMVTLVDTSEGEVIYSMQCTLGQLIIQNLFIIYPDNLLDTLTFLRKKDKQGTRR